MERASSALVERITLAARERLPVAIAEFDVGGLVRKKVSDYPLEKLEDLVLSVARDQLKTIETFRRGDWFLYRCRVRRSISGSPGFPDDKGELVMRKLACLVLLTCWLVRGGLSSRQCVLEIKGSGKRELQKREVAPFTSISTEGAFTIEVTCQKNQSLEVEGDDNVLRVRHD